MRIRRISGCHLASLEDRFDIRLDQEPIKSAGFFAITGNTGAGKSTIIDALCLALYGSTPRLSTGGTGVVTIDDHKVGLNSPENIITTGQNEAWAEVDITGMNSMEYTAHWEIRRKKSGTIAISAWYENTSERTERIEVTGKIAERIGCTITGLNLEQFSRVVVLPQGDFAEFLEAKPGERAELLQQITGMDLYQDINDAVYEKCRNYDKEKETLSAQQKGMVLLADEERSKLLENKQTCTGEINKLTGLSSLFENIDKVKSGLILDQKELETAEAELLKVKSAGSQIEEQEHAVLLYNEFSQHLKPWQNVSNTLKIWQDACEVTKKDGIKAENLRLNVIEAADLQKKAKDRLTAFTAESEASSASLKKALLLDREIQEAVTNLDNKQAVVLKAKEEAAGVIEELKKYSLEMEKALKAQNSAQQNISTLTYVEPMEDKWDLRAKFLSDYARAERSLAERTSVVRTDTEVVNGCSTRLHEMLNKFVADMHELKFSDDFIKSVKNKDDISLYIGKVDEVRQQMEYMKNAVSRIMDIVKQRDDEKNNLQIFVQKAAENTQEAEVMQHNLEAIKKQLQELRKQEADAGIQCKLEEFQKKLLDGAPCPLCGAVHHPKLENAGLNVSAEKVLNEIRTKLKAAENEEEKVSGCLIAAQKNVSRYEESCLNCNQNLDRNKNELKELISQAIQYEKTTILRCREIADKSGYTVICNVGFSSMTSDSRFSEVSYAVQAVDVITNSVQQFEDELKLEILPDITRIDKLNQELDNKKAALIRERDSMEEAVKNRDKSAGDLNVSFLETGVKWTSIFNDDFSEKSVNDKITSITTSVSRLRVAKDDLKRAQDLYKDNLSFYNLKKPISDSANQKVQNAAADVENAVLVLKQKKDERATLLGGMDTLQYENNLKQTNARLTGEEKNSTDLYNQKHTEYVSQNDALVRSHENEKTALTNKDAAAARFAEIEKDILVVHSELQSGDVGRILDTEQSALDHMISEVKAYKDRLAEAEKQVQQKNADCSARKSSCEELMAGIPAEKIKDNELLPEYRQEVLEQLKAQTEVRDRIISEISIDDNNRSKVASILQAGEELDKKYAGFNLLKEIFGSANGFTRFAQTITFRYLLGQANHYLNEFKPRYELCPGKYSTGKNIEAKDIDVVIIDHENGDCSRSVKSLSGGEKFIVSLSLAMALADAVGNSSSGKGMRLDRVDTMFIDEGFGSLDYELLNDVLGVFMRYKGSRTIGIISHVKEIVSDSGIGARVQVDPCPDRPGKSRITVAA